MNPSHKDTIIVDVKGRFLAALDSALDQKDVKIVIVATNMNATEDDDWIATPEAPISSLSKILSTTSNNSVFSMDALRSALLDQEQQNSQDTVTSNSLIGELPFINAFFDPRMISESQEIASEGCFSVDSSSEEDDDDNNNNNNIGSEAGRRHEESLGMFNGTHYDKILSDVLRPSMLRKDGIGRGKLAITFVLYDTTGVSRIFLIKKPGNNSQEKRQWMLPTVVIDSVVGVSNLKLAAALDAFYDMTNRGGRLRVYEHKIVSSGKHHAILLARVEVSEMNYFLNDARSGIVGTFVRNETVYKNMLRRPFDRQRMNFSSQIRRTFMKLKNMGAVVFAKTSGGKWTIRIVDDKFSSGDAIVVNGLDIDNDNDNGDDDDDASDAEWSDDDDDDDNDGAMDEEDGDANTFSYYALDSNEMRSVPMSSENWHHFFSGVKTVGRSRGGSRPRSVTRGRSPSIRRPPVKRARSLPPATRRGLRRIGLGPRPGIPVVRRPFNPRPWGYGRGTFAGPRRARAWLPFLPLAYLGFSNRFYPRIYYHISPGMPYYDSLPRLPSIPMGSSAESIELTLNSLRSAHMYYIQRGYDIVPNFNTWRYQWVSTGGINPASSYY